MIAQGTTPVPFDQPYVLEDADGEPFGAWRITFFTDDYEWVCSQWIADDVPEEEICPTLLRMEGAARKALERATGETV